MYGGQTIPIGIRNDRQLGPNSNSPVNHQQLFQLNSSNWICHTCKKPLAQCATCLVPLSTATTNDLGINQFNGNLDSTGVVPTSIMPYGFRDWTLTKLLPDKKCHIVMNDDGKAIGVIQPIKIIMTEEFLESDVNTICKVLFDETLTVSSELSVFVAAWCWIYKDAARRIPYIPWIMRFVRFHTLSPEALDQCKREVVNASDCIRLIQLTEWCMAANDQKTLHDLYFGCKGPRVGSPHRFMDFFCTPEQLSRLPKSHQSQGQLGLNNEQTTTLFPGIGSRELPCPGNPANFNRLLTNVQQQSMGNSFTQPNAPMFPIPSLNAQMQVGAPSFQDAAFKVVKDGTPYQNLMFNLNTNMMGGGGQQPNLLQNNGSPLNLPKFMTASFPRNNSLPQPGGASSPLNFNQILPPVPPRIPNFQPGQNSNDNYNNALNNNFQPFMPPIDIGAAAQSMQQPSAVKSFQTTTSDDQIYLNLLPELQFLKDKFPYLTMQTLLSLWLDNNAKKCGISLGSEKGHGGGGNTLGGEDNKWIINKPCNPIDYWRKMRAEKYGGNSITSSNMPSLLQGKAIQSTNIKRKMTPLQFEQILRNEAKNCMELRDKAKKISQNLENMFLAVRHEKAKERAIEKEITKQLIRKYTGIRIRSLSDLSPPPRSPNKVKMAAVFNEPGGRQKPSGNERAAVESPPAVIFQPVFVDAVTRRPITPSDPRGQQQQRLPVIPEIGGYREQSGLKKPIDQQDKPDINHQKAQQLGGGGTPQVIARKRNPSVDVGNNNIKAQTGGPPTQLRTADPTLRYFSPPGPQAVPRYPIMYGGAAQNTNAQLSPPPLQARAMPVQSPRNQGLRQKPPMPPPPRILQGNIPMRPPPPRNSQIR